MARIFRIILTAGLIAVCTAEPARFRTFRTNSFFARQEVASDTAPPAKAPYPPAGLKPDIPFELPTETTTTQPDNTYLPPDNNVPDNTYLPPTTTGLPTTTGVPTTTSLPDSTTTEIPDVLIDDDDDTESVISVAVSYDTDIAPEEPQRIVFGQRVQPLSKRPQKLRAIRAQPIFINDDGSFAYSAQLQNW